jgi:membrane associated rhomboid family serine protease
MQYGAVPASIVRIGPWLISGRLMLATEAVGSLVTSMFVHGGLLHLAGNMLYLWVFGDNVEDRLGPGRYLFFYLLTGVIGTATHVMTAPGSQIPLIGASGAIAGVLGAYFVTFPGSRVLTLIPIFLLLTTVEIPAVAFLAFWFILQLFNGVGSLSPGAAESTAWWAHVGGFAAGALLMRVLSPRQPLRQEGWGEAPRDGSWGPST